MSRTKWHESTQRGTDFLAARLTRQELINARIAASSEARVQSHNRGVVEASSPKNWSWLERRKAASSEQSRRQLLLMQWSIRMITAGSPDAATQPVPYRNKSLRKGASAHTFLIRSRTDPSARPHLRTASRDQLLGTYPFESISRTLVVKPSDPTDNRHRRRSELPQNNDNGIFVC